MRALNDVSISCKKGNVHALVGENGAGKSTLIKILSGAQQPDKGTICFKGKNYESFSPVSSELRYQRNLSGVSTCLRNERSRKHLLGREIRTTVGIIDSARMRQEANRLLEQMGLKITVKRKLEC